MQPGWNWRVQAPTAPQAGAGPAYGRYLGPQQLVRPLHYEYGATSGPRPVDTPQVAVADTGNALPRRETVWQASQTAAGPVTTLQQRAPDAEPYAYIPGKWPGRAAQLGRQWHEGNTGNASLMSHGFPTTWYTLRLPVAYIPAARAIWRSLRTFSQAYRSNDRQYIPSVFVPAAPVNTLGVNHAP